MLKTRNIQPRELTIMGEVKNSINLDGIKQKECQGARKKEEVGSKGKEKIELGMREELNSS